MTIVAPGGEIFNGFCNPAGAVEPGGYALLTGWRMTVFSFSGATRLASLR